MTPLQVADELILKKNADFLTLEKNYTQVSALSLK